jgi:hypothetical protein
MTDVRTPRFSSLAPEQNPEDELRDQANDEEYYEADLTIRNVNGDSVARSRKQEKKEYMLQSSHHLATPRSSCTPNHRLL